MSTFEFLQCICKIKKLLLKNDIKLSNNVSLKRNLIKIVNQHMRNTSMTQEEYELIIADITSLLEKSELNETYLINSINDCATLSCLDPNILHVCILALEEIGDNLILTGNVFDPAIGGDESNPINPISAALFGANNIFIENEPMIEPRLFNIPTDKEHSPSTFIVGNIQYDASVPFTQQMLRLEELGRLDINELKNEEMFDSNNLRVPLPDTDSYPNENDLNSFLSDVCNRESGNLGFEPTKRSNVVNPNPWASAISQEIDPLDFTTGVAEGRMGGFNGEHLQWTDTNEPKTISVTCQTGAKINNGCRDSIQRHKYQHGEFGQGGLYHKPLESLPENGTTNGITPKFHSGLPTQKKESLWTFDGTFPPKLLMAKYGEPHILRHYNFLPIKPDKNGGFGLHTITTHEHNGPNSGVSDGFAQSFFFPGEYYDYFYTMTLAAYTHENTDAIHPKAATPMEWQRDENDEIVTDENGRPIPQENRKIPGNWKETMSTHWFHDHMLDYTAQNVYKGNAAMMNYYSALDRGNEEIEDGVNLRLPSGTALSWGNRDYDVNLIVMDKAWDDEGQLWFNPFNTNGFLGDRMMVNWLLEPYFKVRARRYRFRILNASVSRFMKFALVRKFNNSSQGSLIGPVGTNTSYNRVPFWLIANCGNLMMHAIKFDGTNGTTSATLPVQAIAERFDIIVDFSDFQQGDTLYMVNLLEHFSGKRPNREIPLNEILNETYIGDPCVMKFMEFRVQNYNGTDQSLHPSVYEVGKRFLIPIEPILESDLRHAIQRNFNFVNKAGTTDEWAIETDGGEDHQMDPRRLSAAPKTNALELWTIHNGAPTWAHNVHIHFTEGKILLRDDQLPPIWEQFARKDVYRVGGGVDSSESLVIALIFNDSPGDTYMMHCHNTQHEDHAMLLRYDVRDECCTKTLPCPLPTWNGVQFMETKTLPTFKTGMLDDNIFYVKPERLIKKLKQIEQIIPDESTGSYFVNGLGRHFNIRETEIETETEII